jgi:hypothetical protein
VVDRDEDVLPDEDKSPWAAHELVRVPGTLASHELRRSFCRRDVRHWRVCISAGYVVVVGCELVCADPRYGALIRASNRHRLESSSGRWQLFLYVVTEAQSITHVIP